MKECVIKRPEFSGEDNGESYNYFEAYLEDDDVYLINGDYDHVTSLTKEEALEIGSWLLDNVEVDHD